MPTVDALRAGPVFACTLPPPELRRRRIEVLADVRRKVSRIDETSDGYVFTFPRSTGLRAQLEEFIHFEAACCSFITMSIAEAAEGELALKMSAPTEAKSFIRLEFVDLAATSTEPAVSGACGCKA